MTVCMIFKKTLMEIDQCLILLSSKKVLQSDKKDFIIDRLEIFGQPFLPEVPEWNIQDLLKFLDLNSLVRLEEDTL